MESGDITNAQISASSTLDDNNPPGQARLHQKPDGSMAGAWTAQTDDLNQWLQVDLGSYTKVSRVATQGKNGFDQWVTKYKIQYSDDGGNFWVYKEPGTSSAKVSSFLLFVESFYDWPPFTWKKLRKTYICNYSSARITPLLTSVKPCTVSEKLTQKKISSQNGTP